MNSGGDSDSQAGTEAGAGFGMATFLIYVKLS